MICNVSTLLKVKLYGVHKMLATRSCFKTISINLISKFIIITLNLKTKNLRLSLRISFYPYMFFDFFIWNFWVEWEEYLIWGIAKYEKKRLFSRTFKYPNRAKDCLEQVTYLDQRWLPWISSQQQGLREHSANKFSSLEFTWL